MDDLKTLITSSCNLATSEDEENDPQIDIKSSRMFNNNFDDQKRYSEVAPLPSSGGIKVHLNGKIQIVDPQEYDSEMARSSGGINNFLQPKPGVGIQSQPHTYLVSLQEQSREHHETTFTEGLTLINEHKPHQTTQSPYFNNNAQEYDQSNQN